MSKIKFSTKQEQFIQHGKNAQDMFEDALYDSVNDIDSIRPHCYFQSIAGYGKTYTANRIYTEENVKYDTITGKVSFYAFGVRLATLRYQKDLKGDTSPNIILVDDCDIFDKPEHINIIKNILEGERAYVYETSKTPNGLPPLQKAAVEYCQIPGQLGFRVDCSDMVFIFLSNIKLPSKADVEKKNNPMNNHLHAILSRCNYQSFSFEPMVMWGWLSHIVLTTDVISNIDTDGRMIIMDWMYHNWDNMNETSIRVVQKMATAMEKYPENYKDKWELKYLTK